MCVQTIILPRYNKTACNLLISKYHHTKLFRDQRVIWPMETLFKQLIHVILFEIMRETITRKKYDFSLQILWCLIIMLICNSYSQLIWQNHYIHLRWLHKYCITFDHTCTVQLGCCCFFKKWAQMNQQLRILKELSLEIFDVPILTLINLYTFMKGHQYNHSYRFSDVGVHSPCSGVKSLDELIHSE